MIVKAPGVVKLLGEHAVVYGRTAVAMGIRLYAKARLSKIKSPVLIIEIPELSAKGRFDRNRLAQMYGSYSARKSIGEYISGQDEDPNLIPFATIAARLLGEFGIDPTGAKIRLTSQIPIQKGLASSAALSTAFTVALIKNSGSHLDSGKVIDVSRDGDRIIHKNENAGRIDVSAAFYGGYTTFSSSQGARKEDIKTNLNLLIIDTGPKKSTAETVGHVAELHKADNVRVERILDRINDCSSKGINALRSRNLKEFGECMYEDQALLEQLEVSSESLEKAVSISRAHQAHGAKLSGGGGGGIAIALVKRNRGSLISTLRKEGFSVIESRISFEGAESFL